MEKNFKAILRGYKSFRKKYAHGNRSIMRSLSMNGQQPQAMVVACCDSRVDPALILQCDPGDLFVVRNIANIIPPYEKDDAHHGTSAALEFGICSLKVKHLIVLGHSQCGGIQALLNSEILEQNDFVTNWVNMVKCEDHTHLEVDDYVKHALNKSYQNCLTFPWIKDKVESGELSIHLWFFDIKRGEIFTYCDDKKTYASLEQMII